MYKDKGGYTKVLALLLLLCIFFGGLYIYKKSGFLTNKKEVPQEMNTESETFEPPASWAIYTNTKYGYTLHYPSDWEIEGIVGDKAPDAPKVTLESREIDIYDPKRTDPYPNGRISLRISTPSVFVKFSKTAISATKIELGEIEATKYELLPLEGGVTGEMVYAYAFTHPTLSDVGFEIYIHDKTALIGKHLTMLSRRLLFTRLMLF